MPPSRLMRFTKSERLFHWTNAAAVLLLLSTGALIWQDLDKWRYNKMNVTAQVHVWLGGGLLVLGVVIFLLLGRRQQVAQAAKRFNPGQALNHRLFKTVLPLMLTSGVVMKWRAFFGVSKGVAGWIKQGHLVVAGGILALVIGHLYMVFVVAKNRGIVSAMLTGEVDREVAGRVAPEWVAALDRGVETTGAPV